MKGGSGAQNFDKNLTGKARKPNTQKPTANVDNNLKLKGYAELNQESERSDMAGVLGTQNNGQMMPVNIQSTDEMDN